MALQAPKGTRDILPEESYRWQHVEALIRGICYKYGLSEARTPVFEHTELFLRDLEHCGELLYLLDNAGEIVFDKILIRELNKHTRVTAVVKGAPIINDACMEDAEQTGLTAICEVIDNGGPFIGTPVSLINPYLVKRMESADIIVGKGQGNYETVDDFNGNVYLLLKIKCEIVSRHSGAPLGSAAFISTRKRVCDCEG